MFKYLYQFFFGSGVITPGDGYANGDSSASAVGVTNVLVKINTTLSISSSQNALSISADANFYPVSQNLTAAIRSATPEIIVLRNTLSANLILKSVYVPASYYVKYSVGDILYVKYEATREDELEKVCIKEIVVPESNCNAIWPLYMSTDNVLYNENELFTYEEAIISIRFFNTPVMDSSFDGSNNIVYPITFYLISEINSAIPKSNQNTILYIKVEAAKGKLKKVYIKDVKNGLYQDSTNRLWSSSDLLNYNDAKTLAQTYLTGQLV